MLGKRIFLALTLAVVVAVSVTVAPAQSTDADPSTTQSTSHGGGVLDGLERIVTVIAQQLNNHGSRATP